MRQIKWVSGIATEITQNNWIKSPETAESAKKMAGLNRRRLNKTREAGFRRIKKDLSRRKREKKGKRLVRERKSRFIAQKG